MHSFTRLLLLALFILSGHASIAQKVSIITAEDQEFYRQVKLTKEFKAINDSVEAFNADENNIPQEVKFEIWRDDNRKKDNDRFISGKLERKLVIMKATVEGYQFTYDRHAKKITSIDHFKNDLEISR